MADLESTKQIELEELQVELKNIFGRDDLWLFPEGGCAQWIEEPKDGGKVRGFLGTGKTRAGVSVLIVAERPSTGGRKKLDRKLGNFYNLLAERGLANAHLTDFIKTRAPVNYSDKEKAARFYEQEFPKHLPFLKREVEIVRPTKVIAIGHKAWMWLAVTKSFVGLSRCELVYAPHYADRFRKSDFKKNFVKVLGKGLGGRRG